MITLSVVIYIIFLLTSTSLFVVANTTIEPYLDGEYVKKNITIDPEHLKSRLEKVIEHDKTSHKREDANGFIEERNLLSSRNELLQGQQKWGWGRRVMTKAKKHVKKAASGVKKTVTKAASAVKTHVKKAASAVKNKFNTNNDVTWEEPAKGTKFGVAMPGGGVKSIFAMWQIFLKYGNHIFKNAPLVSTNSGSSWAVNQFLFTKKGFFAQDTDVATMQMGNLLDSILNAASNNGEGDEAFNLMTGMIPNLNSKAGPNWMEHMLQASHVKDGWNKLVDDVNAKASYEDGRTDSKMNLFWAQHIVLLPQGAYEGPSYRYCPVGHHSSRKNGNKHGTFRIHNGYCEFCTSSWFNKKCNRLPKVPTSKLWEYELTVDGVTTEPPSIPGYAIKQTSNDKRDKFKVIIPFLKGKKLHVQFSPLHGKSKRGDGKHHFFKHHNSQLLLEKDRMQNYGMAISYEKIIAETQRYYDTLWDTKRERLSAISSAAIGMLNSKKMLKSLKFKIGPLPLNFMQKFVLEIIDEDYDDQGNVIYGKAVKPNAGWANLKDMIFNGGMMGAWPGVGSATQIDMGNLGTSTPLQFSYADGGYADNYGIAAQLRQMSVTGKIHPFVSVISMSSYKGFTQFFSKRLCPYSAGLMQCAGTTKPVDDYTIATYRQPNLIMFEGLPFDGPSKTCQKNPTKKECPTVVPVKSDLVTVENKYFGVKGGMKVKIIFLFYNPGELTLLPSSTKRKEILESASRLTTVLEDAKVLKYLI